MACRKQFILTLTAVPLFAAQSFAWASSEGRPVDSSRIGTDGTAYVTRVIPVPATVSPEAQKMLARVVSDAAVPQTLEQRRTGTDKWQARAGEASKQLYPVNVA